MKAALVDTLARLPAAPTPAYPEGAPFVHALAHGSMSVELYAPGNADGRDRQQPHAQDELLSVVQRPGHASTPAGTQTFDAAPGDVLFVPAGASRTAFDTFTPDFTTWVIFWGPDGGERP